MGLPDRIKTHANSEKRLFLQSETFFWRGDCEENAEWLWGSRGGGSGGVLWVMQGHSQTPIALGWTQSNEPSSRRKGFGEP